MREFTNIDYGMKAVIVENNTGYAVKLIDIDANETLPMVRIFPYSLEKALERAIAYAKSLVQ